jgi:LysR family transcriptional regulator, positive regulator for ilvC
VEALEAMRQFVVLAETLHYGRASSRCHVSASTLSRSIARLEAEVGAQLFVRDRRHVELTEQGSRFRAYALETLDRYEDLQRSLHGGDSLEGSLSIFCTVTASQSVLPQMLSRFRDRFPGVHIELQTGYAANALEMLEEGAVDLTVAAIPARLPAAVLSQPLVATRLLFVAPALEQPPGRIDWSATPMILPPFGLAREHVERWFRARGERITLYSEVASHEAILSLVALGCGVGVVPALVLEKSALRDQVRVVDVRPRLPGFDVGVCTLRRSLRKPLVVAFWTSITGSAPA